MKRAGCCSGSSPSKVPRQRTVADRLGTRKAAMPTNPGQSAAFSGPRGAPTVVWVAWKAGSCRVLSPLLSALPFADQKFPLDRGHLSDQALEELPFLDPSGHLLTELRRNMQSSCPPTLLPSQQCRFMDRTFPSATACGIAAPFLTDRKRGLNERLDLANAREDASSRFIGQCWSCHTW
jgi:hypothetical protein